MLHPSFAFSPASLCFPFTPPGDALRAGGRVPRFGKQQDAAWTGGLSLIGMGFWACI